MGNLGSFLRNVDLLAFVPLRIDLDQFCLLCRNSLPPGVFPGS